MILVRPEYESASKSIAVNWLLEHPEKGSNCQLDCDSFVGLLKQAELSKLKPAVNDDCHSVGVTTNDNDLSDSHSEMFQRCSFDPLLIGGSIVHPAASVRDLGVILDPALSFVSHVARLTGVSFYHIRQLRTIRYSLTTDSCHSLVRALIVSRLDYCNGLLGGAPAFLLDRLSGVLRAAARVVLQLPGRSHITDAMKDQLHWLDIPARVDFKLCVLAFRCLHGSAPPYLARCCTRVIPGRSDLRSASAAKGRLVVPKTDTKTISRKAFAISCPLAWNRLPDELHDDSLSLMEFRRKLKTFLF